MRGSGPARWHPPGPWPVLLRFDTGLTSEDYVSREAWRKASLPYCPNHRQGGCSLSRHGTYERKTPPGTRIARWYCRESHTTFNLLPDCLAARLPGTLQTLEQAVVVAEQAPSLETAAAVLRPGIELPGALRWLRRRRRYVQHTLIVVIGLLPELLGGCAPTITAVRSRLGQDAVLTHLRGRAASYLPALSAPLGFSSLLAVAGDVDRRHQQPMGPDPPASAA